MAANLAGRKAIRPRQMVGLGQAALPAMDELDGGEVLLLHAYPQGQLRKLAAQ